jgi:hypothetical protein
MVVDEAMKELQLQLLLLEKEANSEPKPINPSGEEKEIPDLKTEELSTNLDKIEINATLLEVQRIAKSKAMQKYIQSVKEDFAKRIKKPKPSKKSSLEYVESLVIIY